jgi:hypothetical protein
VFGNLNICLGRCSREVQFWISCGLTCGHVLHVANLFFRTYSHERGSTVFSEITSPVHNMTSLWDAPALHVRVIRIHISLSKLTVQFLRVFGCTRVPNHKFLLQPRFRQVPPIEFI